MKAAGRKGLQALTLLGLAGLAQAAERLPPRGQPPTRAQERPAAIQTSAAGDRRRPLPPLRLKRGQPGPGLVLRVHPGQPRQALVGIGGALTEASAFVLAHLPAPQRRAILDAFYGPSGAKFTLGRVPLGACDFCVTGRWSYDDTPGDVALKHFSLAQDARGFPGVASPDYGLLALVQDALAREPALKLVASPWTAPSWMKDNQSWYGNGRGGRLLPEHYPTFARYTLRALEAYGQAGVPFWGLTPVNEPVGNGGQWESMEFTPEEMRRYLRDHLGPELAAHGRQDVKVIQFDHNRDAHALAFAQAVLGDPETRRFVWGTGVHWYQSTASTGTGILDQLRQDHPDKAVLHTEGCIDGIGTEDSSPKGAFLGWRNDRWWWQPMATDWGYYWAPPAERPDHPRYTPVHRYVRDLIEGLNHGLVGWIDWNIVLDRRGGPNHVGNYCAAPVMVDLDTAEAYVTPLYEVLAHFSRYLDPGDLVVPVTRTTGEHPSALLTTAAIDPGGRWLKVFVFNPDPTPATYHLQVGGASARLTIPGQALQTFRLRRPRPPQTPKRP